MKSMEQIQQEMLSKARFDGGYPRIVVMPIGILAIANSKEEHDKYVRSSLIAHLAMAGCLFGLLVAMVVFIVVKA